MRRVAEWLARLVGAERPGDPPPVEFRSDAAHPPFEGDCWEVDSSRITAPSFLRALASLVTPECFLVLEGRPPRALARFLARNSVAPRWIVAQGTIAPPPSVFHIPATVVTLEALAEITQSLPESEVWWHLHVCDGHGVVLQWYDAFDEPILVSKRLPESALEAFRRSLAGS